MASYPNWNDCGCSSSDLEVEGNISDCYEIYCENHGKIAQICATQMNDLMRNRPFNPTVSEFRSLNYYSSRAESFESETEDFWNHPPFHVRFHLGAGEHNGWFQIKNNNADGSVKKGDHSAIYFNPETTRLFIKDGRLHNDIKLTKKIHKSLNDPLMNDMKTPSAWVHTPHRVKTIDEESWWEKDKDRIQFSPKFGIHWMINGKIVDDMTFEHIETIGKAFFVSDEQELSFPVKMEPLLAAESFEAEEYTKWDETLAIMKPYDKLMMEDYWIDVMGGESIPPFFNKSIIKQPDEADGEVIALSIPSCWSVTDGLWERDSAWGHGSIITHRSISRKAILKQLHDWGIDTSNNEDWKGFGYFSNPEEIAIRNGESKIWQFPMPEPKHEWQIGEPSFVDSDDERIIIEISRHCSNKGCDAIETSTSGATFDFEAESFNVEFNEWADQEMKSHGKNISFKDWSKDEGLKHGNSEITDWAQHEDESHDARYGAETYEDSWEKGVIRLAISGGCFSDEYAEWVERQIDGPSSTLNNPRYKKIIDKRWGLDAENWGGDPKGKLAMALAKARDKSKEPTKPLKLEKLDGGRKKRSGILSEPFDESSLDSGEMKKVLLGIGLGIIGIIGYNKWK